MKKYLILLAMFIGLVSCGITSNDDDKTFMEYKRAPRVRVLDPNLQLSNEFISEIIRLENRVDVPNDYDIITRGDTLIFARKNPDYEIQYDLNHSGDIFCTTDSFCFNKNTGEFYKEAYEIYKLYSDGTRKDSPLEFWRYQVLIDTVLDIVSLDSVIYSSIDTLSDTLVFNLKNGYKAKIGMKKIPNLELFNLGNYFVGRCIVRNTDGTIVASNYMDRYGKFGKRFDNVDFLYLDKGKVLDSIIVYEIKNGYKDKKLQNKINYVARYKKIPHIDISCYDKFTDVERRILYMFIQRLLPLSLFDKTIVTNNLDTTGYWEYDEDTKKYEFEEWSE